MTNNVCKQCSKQDGCLADMNKAIFCTQRDYAYFRPKIFDKNKKVKKRVISSPNFLDKFGIKLDNKKLIVIGIIAIMVIFIGSQYINNQMFISLLLLLGLLVVQKYVNKWKKAGKKFKLF